MSWFLNRKIVMLDGFPSSREKLEEEEEEEEDVDVIPVDMSEFIKSGGPHCASAPLSRGPGPKL